MSNEQWHCTDEEWQPVDPKCEGIGLPEIPKKDKHGRAIEGEFEPIKACERITVIERIDDKKRCFCYMAPAAWWRKGNCPRATNITAEPIKKGRVRVGQQKQSRGR